MTSRIYTYGMIAMLMLALPCLSQELKRLDVAVTPFEALGQADPDFAETLARQLMRAIERDSEFRVVPGGSNHFYLKGQVLVDGQRHFVTLTLFEAKTDRTLWFENYDFRNITADMMAADVIAALSAASGADAWE